MTSTPLRIPVSASIEASYGVYVQFEAVPNDLKTFGSEWATRMTWDPIRSALTNFIGTDHVRTNVVARADAPEPSIEVLRAMHMGPDEERRFREATHVVRVSARSSLRQPPLNVLGALAVAKGLALRFNGVVCDLQAPRLLSIASIKEALPFNGRVITSKYIASPMSTAPGGGAWMTTVGMQAFGLPNLVMKSIPPHLGDVLPVMNAVAHRILHEAFAQAAQAAQAGDKPLTELVLPAALVVTRENLTSAFGKVATTTGQTTVGLRLEALEPGGQPMLLVEPPAAFAGEVGEWYYAMLGEILGRSVDRAPVNVAASDEVLEKARVRAISEWAGVRKRFLQGLAPDQKLLVKRGFPLPTGSNLEFLWVSVMSLPEGEIVGMLANTSVNDTELRAGRQVRFAESELFDWMITQGKQRQGGYSIDVLISTPGERA